MCTKPIEPVDHIPALATQWARIWRTASGRFPHGARGGGDLSPLPGLICLAAADPQSEPVGDNGDVFDAKRSQFGAPQRADEAEQQQRAVTPATSTLIAGGKQLARFRQNSRRLV